MGIVMGLCQTILKKTARQIAVLLLFSFLAASVFAQEKALVSGKVTNGKTPLSNVSVKVLGSKAGTTSDEQGNFRIAAAKGQTLVFSYIGYAEQQVLVADQPAINVELVINSLSFDSVVVVGYGTQKKTSLTAAVSTMKGKEIASTPVTNLSNSLGGRLSGVIVTQNTGDPGRDGSSIFVRGVSSTGSNQPLIIVDGVPRDFTQLDPNSIETFTVLKDAAAVAPYGVAGANGVILVTTKRGKRGEPTLTYNGYVGFQNPTVLPKFANGYQYALLRNMASQNEGLPLPYNQFALQKLRDHSDPDALPDPNVWDLIHKNAILTNHNIEISGGTEKVKYYGSFGYQYQEAMFASTNNRKYNLTLNLDAQATPTTKISINVNGRNQNTKYPGIAPGRVFELLQYVNTRRGALYYSNGLPGDKIPATIYGSGYEKINTMALYSQIAVEQDLPFIPGLKARGAIAYDPSNSLDKLWRLPTHINSIVDTSQHPYVFKNAIFDQPLASLNETHRQSYQLTYQASLNYVKSFGSSNITVLALFEAKSNDSLSLAASRRNYNVTIDEIDLGSSSQADMTTNGSSNSTRQLGLLYRLTYDYAQKYFFEASGRYDGSYYFAPGNRFGFFPAFSAGWRLSQENFLKDITCINNLKIRGSYGEVGALAGAPFQYLSTYSVYGPAYVLGGQAVQAANERSESNPNITWERAKKTDIGFDLSLWNGLLTLEADYFYEKRSNMLVSPSVIVPAEYGIGLSQVNGGEMKNQGIDFSIGSAYSLSKDLQVSLQGNFTYARNTLLKVFETSATFDNPNRRVTGKPLGTQFGFEAIGYFQEADFNPDGTLKSGIAVQPWGAVHPGDLRYEDISGDGKINNDDLTKIGNAPTPMIIYGIAPSVRYKNLSLDLLFQGSANANLYMDRQMQWPFYNSMNAYVANFNSWTPDNPNAKYPRLTNAPTTNNSQQSSWWMTNVSYLRLKSATLAYSLPYNIIHKIKIQNVRVFVSGQNILTWTKLQNYDPENAGAYTNLYPQQKVISAGLNVTF